MRRIKLPTKSMSFWVAIILSVAAGLAVLFALYTLYMPTKVLVPQHDIKAGVVIGQNDIGQITISKKDKHASTISDPRLVIGKYAKEQLYAKEPILAQKLTNDPKNTFGDGSVLKLDETFFTFKPSDARWPNGIKTGDYVSVMGVPKAGNPVIIGAKIKVVSVSGESKVSSGQIDQLKSVVTSSDDSITLQMRWKQVGSLFTGRNISDEIWILPEHPDKETGGTIYDQGDIARIRSEANYQASTGKGNPKSQKLIPGSR